MRNFRVEIYIIIKLSVYFKILPLRLIGFKIKFILTVSFDSIGFSRGVYLIEAYSDYA